MAQPVKWIISGTGSIAHDFIRDLSLIDGQQQVVAVIGHSEDSTKEFAEQYDIPAYYTDLEQALKDVNADVAYVASPHTLHHEQAKAFLKKGIHVLCEKPMTINREQAAELVSLSQKKKRFLMEGMWIRFLPSITKVLELINDGVIGKVTTIKASMCYKAPRDPDNRYFDPELGGGSLLDLGIYPVFLSLLLLGKPDTIKAIGTLTDEGIDEECSMLLHYRNGQHAVLESSLRANTDMPAEIAGEKGVIKILDPWYEKAAGIEVEVYGQGKIVYPSHWQGHGLHYETAEVLRCIHNGKTESTAMPHAFSLQLMEVMDEVRRQIKVTYDMYE
ncbi:Gfo/Idh/MocA family oxidoreductase [Nostoc ellipsosporum NOK]|nr:Gfo/Idh/MocA family oxidoreductase [Nostoc ellipsosporum NOK]